MGAAACLLKEQGFEIEGADDKFGPPMSDYLVSTGIPCHYIDETESEFLKTFDLIVIGNMTQGDSERTRAIEELGVPFASFPTTLGALLLDEIPHVVGLSGTHGKTTTTYIGTQLFENLGAKPGYLVGGVIEGRESASLGDGKLFFIESDEYESCYFEKYSKFQNYCINDLVVTSIEFDHADFFESIESIKKEFLDLIQKVDKSFIINSDYPVVREILGSIEERKLPFFQYGKDFLGPLNICMTNNGSNFEIKFKDETLQFKTNLIGTHNIENLSSMILYALYLGYKAAEIDGAIKNLLMVKRRQEVRGRFRETTVIDDFAHHPRAVEGTIESIRIQYPDKKILVVFGASSATARSDLFQSEFIEALESADEVILPRPENSTNIQAVGDLDCDLMANELNAKGIVTTVVNDLTQLISELERKSDSDKIFLILSNSSCLGLWESRFVEELIN